MNTETPDSFEKFEDLRPIMQETLGRDIGVFKKVIDAKISIIQDQGSSLQITDQNTSLNQQIPL